MSASESDQHKLDFSGLILGFSSAALDYLGEAQGSKSISRSHLELARQNIDIIELLLAKTRGNLTPEEDGLTRGILSDLRIKFVEKSRILL